MGREVSKPVQNVRPAVALHVVDPAGHDCLLSGVDGDTGRLLLPLLAAQSQGEAAQQQQQQVFHPHCWSGIGTDSHFSHSG